MSFVVGFLCLVLGAACTRAIQISPEAGLRNATSAIVRTADDEVIPIPMALVANRTLGTEISTSERQRRLIPYMAYYKPPTDYPINQKYLVQVPSKQLQHQSPQKSQKQQHVQQQQPQPAIPLPTAYVHMKVPINNQQSHHSSQNHHQTAPAFQTIVYGGQHPLTQLKEINKVPQVVTTQQRVPIRNLPNNHKSVGQQQYHQPQQLQPVAIHSQKINLTPFSPANTVPGHFIPIIYTNEQQGNSINYNPTAPSSAPIDSHQQQQQQLHQYNEVSNIGQLKEHQLQQHQSLASHKKQQKQQLQHQQQQIAEEYHRHQRPHGEIVVTIPASPVPSSELLPKTLSHIQQQDRQHVQYVAVQTTPRPGSSPNLRIVSDVPTETHHHHHQEQYSNANNLTPQQKYVIYLQQQLRYKQQQQLQEHQKEHIQLEKHLQQHQQQQHQQQQQQQQQHQYQPPQQQYHPIQQTEQRHYVQPEHIYVVSTTVGPPVLPSTQQSIDVHHDTHHNLNRFNEKYPQHSPISHVVHQHSGGGEVITNPEQILHPRKQQKQSYPRPEGHRFATHQLQPHQQYPSNPNYVEYVIDDPKQEIEEPSTSQESDHRQSIRPPPVHLVNNVPLPPPSAVEVVVTSPRPSYKNQPTLRLHAISPTARPSGRPYTQPSYSATPTPPTVFVSSKPKYGQIFPTSAPTPVKLKPSQKYEVDNEEDDDPLPDINTSSLAEILRKLQESNHLPQTLTPDNIDNSIKTLIKILNNLKKSQTIVDTVPQHHEDVDYDYNNAGNEDEAAPPQQDLSAPTSNVKAGPNSGRPGIDYPTLASIPVTEFDCQEQRYKGFFGDPETNCQVWHYCDLNGGKASFLCPNGTIFSQIALTCDWWFNVKCAQTPQLYVLNERLYKYILPFTPKFPEDYSGPIVDKYLALKFKEMEEKMIREKLKGRGGETQVSASDEVTETSAEDGSTEPLKNKIAVNNGGGIRLSAIGEQSSEKNLLIDEENGRITSRASSADTYTTSTQATAKELPLSLQPIVVSTTASPFTAQDEDDEADDEGNSNINGDKVSVEKVEVIEIKSDGSSGHLIPDERYNSADT